MSAPDGTAIPNSVTCGVSMALCSATYENRQRRTMSSVTKTHPTKDAYSETRRVCGGAKVVVQVRVEEKWQSMRLSCDILTSWPIQFIPRLIRQREDFLPFSLLYFHILILLVGRRLCLKCGRTAGWEFKKWEKYRWVMTYLDDCATFHGHLYTRLQFEEEWKRHEVKGATNPELSDDGKEKFVTVNDDPRPATPLEHFSTGLRRLCKPRFKLRAEEFYEIFVLPCAKSRRRSWRNYLAEVSSVPHWRITSFLLESFSQNLGLTCIRNSWRNIPAVPPCPLPSVSCVFQTRFAATLKMADKF